MKFIEHINNIEVYVAKKKEENRKNALAGNAAMTAVDGKGFSTVQVNAYRVGNTTHINTNGNGTLGHVAVTRTPFGLMINQ